MSAEVDLNTNKATKIYVRLLNEGTDVSRPIEVLPMGKGLFKVLPTADYDSEDETWEFPPDAIVRCERRQSAEGEYLMAVRP